MVMVFFVNKGVSGFGVITRRVPLVDDMLSFKMDGALKETSEPILI